MKMQGTCVGPKWLTGRLKAQVGKMVQITFGRARHGEKSGLTWRSLNLVQRVLRVMRDTEGEQH